MDGAVPGGTWSARSSLAAAPVVPTISQGCGAAPDAAAPALAVITAPPVDGASPVDAAGIATGGESSDGHSSDRPAARHSNAIAT